MELCSQFNCAYIVFSFFSPLTLLLIRWIDQQRKCTSLFTRRFFYAFNFFYNESLFIHRETSLARVSIIIFSVRVLSIRLSINYRYNKKQSQIFHLSFTTSKTSRIEINGKNLISRQIFSMLKTFKGQKLWTVEKSKGKIKNMKCFASLPDFSLVHSKTDNEYCRLSVRTTFLEFSILSDPCVCINEKKNRFFFSTEKTMKRFFQLWNYFQFSSLLLCWTNEWMYELKHQIQMKK